MTRDPWDERFEDEEYLRETVLEQTLRRREQASLDAPPARTRVELLEPDRGPMPDLSWQGEPPEYRTVWEKIGFAIAVIFCVAIGLAFALALAILIIEVVAWGMSG